MNRHKCPVCNGGGIHPGTGDYCGACTGYGWVKISPIPPEERPKPRKAPPPDPRRSDPAYWTTSAGDHLKIATMDREHARNAVNYLHRAASGLLWNAALKATSRLPHPDVTGEMAMSSLEGEADRLLAMAMEARDNDRQVARRWLWEDSFRRQQIINLMRRADGDHAQPKTGQASASDYRERFVEAYVVYPGISAVRGLVEVERSDREWRNHLEEMAEDATWD